MTGEMMAVALPKKTKPIMPAITRALVAMTRPKNDIQIREEACLRISGLPEEPMYWMPAMRKLITAKTKAAKMATRRTLLRSLMRPAGPAP